MIDPLIGSAAISGLTGIGGGLLSSSSSAKAAAKAQEAQIQWEMYRAHHAHQWEVEDLKAAGLNPILSAGGSGATTGGISAPMPDTSGYQTAGHSLLDAINSAIAAKRAQAEIALQAEQAANVRQDTTNKFTQNGLFQAEIDMKLAELGLMPYKSASAKAQSEIDQARAEFAKSKEFAGIVRDYASSVGALIGAGGLSAMAISKLARGKNHVPMNKNYERYGGIETTGYYGNYLH